MLVNLAELWCLMTNTPFFLLLTFIYLFTFGEIIVNLWPKKYGELAGHGLQKNMIHHAGSP